MVDITTLHIHYRELVSGKAKVKKVKPVDATNTLAIKKDIAEAVDSIRNKAEYYYVVVEIDRDGKPAYRTVVPKTIL
jgi:hypothetical protein